MNLLPSITGLCLVLIVGYLGQRARLCFIGGMRNYYLVRDTYLIKGLLAFLVAALVGFGIFCLFSPALKTFPWFLHGGAVFAKKWAASGIAATPSPVLPVPGDPISWSPNVGAHLILSIIGGIGLGFCSTMAGGCPYRQHIMASEGSRSAIVYLIGFASGAIVFHKFTAPLVKLIVG